MPRSEINPIQFDPAWWQTLQAPFMQHALIGGTFVALAAGLLGYFVVIRQHAFASHALAHIGFPGATGAVLLGQSVTLGLAVFTIVGALAIGAVGKEVASREIVTGTVLAFATGLGILFSNLATRNAGTVTNVLFGNLLAISVDQLWTFGVFCLAVVVALGVVARPLTFASIDPQVARARGVPVRLLGLVFLVLLALVITMAVQVVGTLLLFALVVTPTATALRITARPAVVAGLGSAIALVAVWVGIVLSAMFDLPPSFFVVTLAVLTWAVVLVVTRGRGGRGRALGVPVASDAADAHHGGAAAAPVSAGVAGL